MNFYVSIFLDARLLHEKYAGVNSCSSFPHVFKNKMIFSTLQDRHDNVGAVSKRDQHSFQ